MTLRKTRFIWPYAIHRQYRIVKERYGAGRDGPTPAFSIGTACDYNSE